MNFMLCGDMIVSSTAIFSFNGDDVLNMDRRNTDLLIVCIDKLLRVEIEKHTRVYAKRYAHRHFREDLAILVLQI